MAEWTVVVSPVDGRPRTVEEIAALLPAVGAVVGVRLGRCGEEGRHVTGRGVGPLGEHYWLSGSLCDPGEFGRRYESCQLEPTVEALPEDGGKTIAAEMYKRLRDDARFHAVLMSNFVAIEATHADKALWWT